jgi:hypothetical protein
VAVTGYLFLGVFSASLKGVYTAALYRYATKGEDDSLDGISLGRAFRPK